MERKRHTQADFGKALQHGLWAGDSAGGSSGTLERCVNKLITSKEAGPPRVLDGDLVFCELGPNLWQDVS